MSLIFPDNFPLRVVFLTPSVCLRALVVEQFSNRGKHKSRVAGSPQIPFEIEKSSTECWKVLGEVFGDNTMSRANVFE